MEALLVLRLNISPEGLSSEVVGSYSLKMPFYPTPDEKKRLKCTLS